ncbi:MULTISPECIES: hypothetical protein [unclassified Rhodococcus (in: high G+C Gram-positive bacteria)]|uniref:hypothetical protein n=1 Tax=unclassified Rhodococcus (in: high G+C Gram-positive bacteria) TaxID=192944 RepID=UPI003399C555
MTGDAFRVERAHAGAADLSVVAQWYQTLQVRQWMSEFEFARFAGGLDTVGSASDGGHTLRLGSYAWIGYDGLDPVSFVGGEVRRRLAGRTLMVGRTAHIPDVDGPASLGVICAVAPGRREEGFGRRTMHAVLSVLPTMDTDACTVECSVDINNDASLALFRSLNEFTEDATSSTDIRFRHQICSTST